MDQVSGQQSSIQTTPVQATPRDYTLQLLEIFRAECHTTAMFFLFYLASARTFFLNSEILCFHMAQYTPLDH